jgi:hypothetical protein
MPLIIACMQVHGKQKIDNQSTVGILQAHPRHPCGGSSAAAAAPAAAAAGAAAAGGRAPGSRGCSSSSGCSAEWGGGQRQRHGLHASWRAARA